jgi:hypothetical protein
MWRQNKVKIGKVATKQHADRTKSPPAGSHIKV